MILHIVPQLFHLMANKCHLESIVIPELDFKIEVDALSTGRPHPNKNIWVGMRKGRKATNGLLLKTDKHLKWFTADYQWHIENMGLITHRVTTYIEDNEFDMISQDIMLNGGFEQWENRRHSAYDEISPAKISLEWNLFYRIPVNEIHMIHGGYLIGGFSRTQRRKFTPAYHSVRATEYRFSFVQPTTLTGTSHYYLR